MTEATRGSFTKWVRRAGGSSLVWQFATVVVVWACLVTLHWDNDGLWYQGDSSRHAANGVFWWDFIGRFPADPVRFGLSYFARYPVINPTAWPPLFYLVEGGVYHALGISGFAAKGLVLVFALLASGYLLLWLRRWAGTTAGWGAGLLLLQPGIITWSHAVMLSIPSMALGVAALYHWRRWLEEPRSRQIYPAAVFAVCAVLTYLPVAVLCLVMSAWTLLMGRARCLLKRRTLGIVAIGLLPLAAWAFVAAKWAPSHGAVAMLEGGYPFWAPAAWTFYLLRLPLLISGPVLVLLGVSALLWLTAPSLRREMAFCGLWFAVCYVWFSAISVKEVRYALLLVPPSVCMGVSAIAGGIRAFAPRIRPYLGQLVPVVLIMILALHVVLAPRVVVPKVSGFEAIIAFLKDTAPSEFVFYDGEYAGVFAFYLRARDPHFAQGVVLGSKLLYAIRIEARYGLVPFSSTPEEVIARLRGYCGCRLVIVERREGPSAENIPAAHSLRTALTGRQFRFVRSFKIISPETTDVDVYEQLGPITSPDSIQLPFPGLGGGITYSAQPIRR